MSDYEQLHRQCRTLENLFDTKLTSYSQLAASLSRQNSDIEATGSAERWRDLESELDDLLEKACQSWSMRLEETNEHLGTLSNTPELLSPSMLRAIQRHREVFQDNARELRRTKTSVKSALEQANLLSGVRNDIEYVEHMAHLFTTLRISSAYKSSAADSLLAERGRIDSSHRMTDDVLEQAYETRSEFARQRTSLAGINTRMIGVLNTMPGINNVIGMIRSRRRRDSIILGLVVGVCIIIILTYMWN
ncbi:hypothetical protein H0H81_004983 [Sphagnurus paluster]|uniref:Golgi SNAP receptor complex member 1 n=1 Tax=Sphagnurus paluster TaxID=117069 RepID=A0A9P7KJV9_9AGAR|nr:hypothetical protein H0H81_004983 [Sphagnurus paluster]